MKARHATIFHILVQTHIFTHSHTHCSTHHSHNVRAGESVLQKKIMENHLGIMHERAWHGFSFDTRALCASSLSALGTRWPVVARRRIILRRPGHNAPVGSAGSAKVSPRFTCAKYYTRISTHWSLNGCVILHATCTWRSFRAVITCSGDDLVCVCV